MEGIESRRIVNALHRYRLDLLAGQYFEVQSTDGGGHGTSKARHFLGRSIAALEDRLPRGLEFREAVVRGRRGALTISL